MIGIFGGTFDPVHFGHLRTALEVCEALELDEMRWVPCRQPPHRRQPVASPDDRLQMLELALQGAPDCFVLDRREMEREGPSYMVDTLASMREQWPKASLCLVLGQDAFLGLDLWHRWRELLDLSHIVVMRRPGAFPLDSNPAVAEWAGLRMTAQGARLRGEPFGLVHAVEVTQLPISATAIRAILAGRRRADYLLPSQVMAYIRAKGLYSTAV
ncbi:nicotinate-nucleotide adenylyltransferase [Methyloterricola oryzae]|uniref:nicotinate-nucleotide adenylyltransferase n=1 Tax=Methyloterricola oryzae TaxID=1495050 RepID=UPI0005EB6E4F|nr:nicotinate-nucleotide adenylyltransferase [Methyloterricola oryzae]